MMSQTVLLKKSVKTDLLTQVSTVYTGQPREIFPMMQTFLPFNVINLLGGHRMGRHTELAIEAWMRTRNRLPSTRSSSYECHPRCLFPIQATSSDRRKIEQRSE